jgi:hypothetical protein
VFFVVRLHPLSKLAELPPINDPDALISNDLMDGRDAFLMLSRDKHYEFSSLRRAKFSSLGMLYELHTQARDSFVYTCNNCHANVDTRYHCAKCDVSCALTFILMRFLCGTKLIYMYAVFLHCSSAFICFSLYVNFIVIQEWFTKPFFSFAGLRSLCSVLQ